MVLMMPGAGDGPEDYAEHGFIEQLRRSRVAADVIAIDAHSGYYREESVVERVLTDVIRVERQRGYEKVWIVGISLGGGGTMHLTATHPDEVDGVVLLAPYLGSPRLVRSVRAAGGAHQWSDDSPESADPFRAIWTWLAHRHRSDASVVPVHVAWGNADRMAPVAETLALSLPESQTLQGGGGHKWVVWRDLWRGLTERGFLQRSCGVVD